MRFLTKQTNKKKKKMFRYLCHCARNIVASITPVRDSQWRQFYMEMKTVLVLSPKFVATLENTFALPKE